MLTLTVLLGCWCIISNGLLIQRFNWIENEGFFDKSTMDSTGDTNPDDPTANKYSIIGTISAEKENYKGADGKYEFRLVWINKDGDQTPIDVTWKQSSWITDTVITGYEAIDVPDTVTGCNKFHGLAKSDSDSTYIDGNGNIGCWYNAICPYVEWGGSYPGFNDEAARSNQLFLVKHVVPESNLLIQAFNWVSGQGYFDKVSMDAIGNQNSHDPTADKYSIIGNIGEQKERYRADDGAFYFKLIWINKDGDQTPIEVTWKQITWITDDTIIGFEPINVPDTVTDCSKFHGLAKSSSATSTYIDGNGHIGCWFSAIAPFVEWGGSYPGFNGKAAKSNHLYILSDVVLGNHLIQRFNWIENEGYFDQVTMDVTGNTNELYPTASKYSIIGTVSGIQEKYRNYDGKYEFKLIWVNKDGDQTPIDVTWKQSSWITDIAISGYEAIDVPDTVTGCNKFHGLAKSNSGTTYIDGNGHDGCWYNAICPYVAWGGSYPGFNSKPARSNELYIVTSVVDMILGELLIQRFNWESGQGYFDQISMDGNGNQNENFPTSDKYSIIGSIGGSQETYRNADGKFYFRLLWVNKDGDQTPIEVVWKQSSWITDTVITGYEAISVPDTVTGCDQFHGLAKSNSGTTYIDGNGHEGCWYNAIAPYVEWSGSYPGFNGKPARSNELYIIYRLNN